MMNFVLKSRNCVLKMMNFAGSRTLGCAAIDLVLGTWVRGAVAVPVGSGGEEAEAGGGQQAA